MVPIMKQWEDESRIDPHLIGKNRSDCGKRFKKCLLEYDEKLKLCGVINEPMQSTTRRKRNPVIRMNLPPHAPQKRTKQTKYPPLAPPGKKFPPLPTNNPAPCANYPPLPTHINSLPKEYNIPTIENTMAAREQI